MGRRQLKKEVLALLTTRDLDFIKKEIVKFPPKAVLNPLFIALCHQREDVRWFAVSCFGVMVPRIEAEDIEDARVVMRRFLWTLNDESGGIGWGAPESLAEVMCHSRILRQEYLHMLISYMREDGAELFQDGNYLELPLLQRGLLWGVGKLCDLYPEEMLAREVEADLLAYLHSPDRKVGAMALWALANLNCKVKPLLLKPLVNESDFNLQLYLEGSFTEIPVKMLLESVTE